MARSENVLHALETMFDEQVQDIQRKVAHILEEMQTQVAEANGGELSAEIRAAFTWGQKQAEGWRLMGSTREVRQRVTRMTRAEDACQEAIRQMRAHAEEEIKDAKREENRQRFSAETRVFLKKIRR